MTTPRIVEVFAADAEPAIPLSARVLTLATGGRALPVVEYVVPELRQDRRTRTIVFLAGGGSSGVIMARVAQLCAERGIRLVMFDVPGHTPPGVLDEGIDPAALLRHAGPRVRARTIALVVDTWLRSSGCERLEIMAHSAGFPDASRLPRHLSAAVHRFYVLGSMLPGVGAMTRAVRAARAMGTASPMSLRDLLRTRSLPSGGLELHFGPAETRRLPDELLRHYQGREHVGVVLDLLRRSSFGTAAWRGATVELVASRGDRVAPPERMRRTAEQLESLGAHVRFHCAPLPLPHMFMMFEAGAAYVRDVVLSSPPREI